MWYIQEFRNPETGRLVNFVVLPDYTYREKFHRNLYQGPFTEWQAEQRKEVLVWELENKGCQKGRDVVI